ncbi:unnamed protein product [Spirodela intermedia]|uniref:Uncharacterized protein n=2 Tax=Spirodela intermedia TaxID=51605 RepID=A0A7I8IQ52_SPIIN|nr:unnamed protein product [Spirodela intermedia]CAA6659121.1 unnamed protein product [Spirodela intermedia]CAA7395422.1 unnamed protein product [Spirodela intermedia]
MYTVIQSQSGRMNRIGPPNEWTGMESPKSDGVVKKA